MLPRNLRVSRRHQILVGKRKILGIEDSKTGERWWKHPLEGPRLNQHYFPSKFALQSFHIDEYYEMQASRFRPRPEHPAILELAKMLKQLSSNGQGVNVNDASANGLDVNVGELQSWLDAQKRSGRFYQSQQLQDLQGLLDLSRVYDGRDMDSLNGESIKAAGDSTSVTEAAFSSSSGPAADELFDESSTRQTKDAQTMMYEQLFDIKQTVDIEEFEGLFDRLEALEASQAEDYVRRLWTKICADSMGTSGETSTDMPSTDGAAPTRQSNRSALKGVIRSLTTANNKTSSDAEEGSAASEPISVEKLILQPKPRKLKYNRAQFGGVNNRFVDPMFRRRRLKWLQRYADDAHKDKELKYNPYYISHPDLKDVWPENKGSVTIPWPSRLH